MTTDRLTHSKKSWFALHIPYNATTEEHILTIVFDLGCCGCQQSDAFIIAYFESSHDPGQIKQALIEHFAIEALPQPTSGQEIEYQYVPEEDWLAKLKEHFKPLAVTDRVIVTPTWEPLEPQPDKIVIQIDPKQAFGTGHHVTTQMALRLLEKYVSQGDFLLDVGTGTGILAISALKLGAHRAVPLDIDPVAVEAAAENCKLNGVSSKIRLIVGETATLQNSAVKFNLVLANINKDEIVSLLPGLNDFVAATGHIILSGILREERQEILQRIAEIKELRVAKSLVQEEWLALVLSATFKK